MPIAIRTFYGLATASFVVTGILLVVAPDAAKFGVASFALVVAGFGLALATDVAGTAQAVARWVGDGSWAPGALASQTATRVWGAVCLLGGLAFAAQALLDPNF